MTCKKTKARNSTISHNITASTAANSVQKTYYMGGTLTKNPQQKKKTKHVHTHKTVMVGDSSVTEQQVFSPGLF